jgi:hypothetical protein
MKKSVLLAIAFILCLGVTGAFAVGTTLGYGTALPTGLNGALSNNVKLTYQSSADNSGYTAATYHDKGTRTFGASSGDAALYYAITTGHDIPGAPSGTESAQFGADWTKI